MITKVRFDEIKNEVKTVIVNTFNTLIDKNIDNFILFVADGEYLKDLEKDKTYPYVIDYMPDSYNDQHRLKFLIKFLNDYYSFSEDQIMVADDHMRIITEMMIYTHIWESKPNLKKLYRLSGLVNQERYVWDSSNIVPDYCKRDFIKGIREKFDKKGNQIGEFIKKGYHSSLRNAFAHSEYSFFMTGDYDIKLLNYREKDSSWALKGVAFDEWSERFVYSILLCYYLNHYHYSRKEIIEAIRRDTFMIEYPDHTKMKISYQYSNNSFYSQKISH